MDTKKLAALFVAVMLACTIGGQPVQAAEPEETVGQLLLISEIQTGSATNATQEFVELHNQSELAIDITGWRLEYKSAAGTSWSTQATLAGQVGPRGFYLAATAGYLENPEGRLLGGLAAAGGHIRVVSPEGVDAAGVLDLAGWGTADTAEGGQPAAAPGAGQSIQRCLSEGTLTDTDNNAADFQIYDTVTPGQGVLCLPPQEEPPKETPEDPATTPGCEGVVISELLPNAAGADTGKEFIELYNPTTGTISLHSCGLQTTGSSTIYWFPANAEISPEEYQAWYDSTTSLSLPNAAGGTVYLLATANTEVHTAAYPPDMPDDAAWARFATGWQATYAPTPSAANALLASKPCPAGQERSEDTGQCRGIVAAAATLAPCQPGQERNPATNRCRTLANTSPALAPCKPGQERNPETNRCRAITAAQLTLKPCAPGQERNPETNRCRKVSAASTGADMKVQDVAAGSVKSSIGWWVAGIVGTGALGYAVYEWRQDIRQHAHKLRTKIMRVPPKRSGGE